MSVKVIPISKKYRKNYDKTFRKPTSETEDIYEESDFNKLQKIDSVLDACDMNNGDAPHRVVDRCTRIRVLAGQV
jgi:hypothetical protein